MMLFLAVSDAYGSGFEFRAESSIRKYNDAESYHPFPEHKVIPGRYTDDTQMSIAIAEALTEHVAEIQAGWIWPRECLATHFVKAFQRDPRSSYSPGFGSILKAAKDGQDLLKTISGNSDKSGAAMRAMPIGFLKPLDKVLQFSSIQAAVTHNTPGGIAAALASAAAAHYFIYDVGPKADLAKWLEKTVPGYPWSTPWVGKVSTNGIECVRAAITAILGNDGLKSILKASVGFTGDTDTVAAIAVACASESKEIKQDLPDALINGLEDGQYGKKYLMELDEKLKKFLA